MLTLRSIAGVGLLACAATAPAAERLRYRLNGLEVQATYAQGREARDLAARFRSRHPAASGEDELRSSVRGTWRHARAMDGVVSHVLQVRGAGDGLEAIESALDTRQSVRRTPEPPLWLPPASRLTTHLEFIEPGASMQWVARSAWSPEAVSRWLRVCARMRRWQVVQSGDALSLGRDRERLEVAVLPEPGGKADGSVVVMTGWVVR